MSLELIRSLPRALSAEALKLRGTLALWMSLVAPLAIVALVVLQLALGHMAKQAPFTPEEAWSRYGLGVLTLWAFLMMPLFVTLQSALLAGLEHGNHQWKHLFALPLPKGVHYLSKLVALTGMLGLAMLVLFAMIPLGGWMLSTLQPRLGIAGAPPLGTIARDLSAIFAAGLLIVALHTWIALRWRSFTVAVSIGMVATVAGFLIMQSKDYGYLYPWSMPVSAVAGHGLHMAFVVKAGLVGGALVTAAGLWNFVRREDV